MANNDFNFQKFIDDSKKVLMSPKEYFQSMEKTGGYVEPIIKVVIYGLASGMIALILSLLHLGAMGGLVGRAAGIGSLFMAPIIAVIGLFIGGLILLIISMICKGNTDFEANVRVIASIQVISPISALAGIFSGFNLYLGAVVSIAVSIYGLWLLYNAVIHALSGDKLRIRIVAGILALLSIIVTFSSISAKKMLKNRLGGQLDNINDEEVQKQIQEAAENMKKLFKEAQE